MIDLYGVIGSAPDAADADLRESYAQALERWLASCGAHSPEVQCLVQAFSFLADARMRCVYDLLRQPYRVYYRANMDLVVADLCEDMNNECPDAGSRLGRIETAAAAWQILSLFGTDGNTREYSLQRYHGAFVEWESAVVRAARGCDAFDDEDDDQLLPPSCDAI